MEPDIKRAISGCLGKCAYDSEAMATRIRLRREKATGTHLRVYRCDLAPHWHLASVPMRGFAKVQERCGVCLEPFESTGPDDWACTNCKVSPAGAQEQGDGKESQPTNTPTTGLHADRTRPASGSPRERRGARET